MPSLDYLSTLIYFKSLEMLEMSCCSSWMYAKLTVLFNWPCVRLGSGSESGMTSKTGPGYGTNHPGSTTL
jgi:hypothetical protein